MAGMSAGKSVGRNLALALCVTAATVAIPPARADSWELPTVESYFSADRQWRLEVRPRPITDQLGYFGDAVEGRAQPGGLPGATQISAQASLQRLRAGAWSTLWQGSLLNDVAPVSALVAPSGRFVTFDNWHSSGYGPQVVVIYDAQGRPVRSMGLKDFLPAEYVAVLGRTVSSVLWSGEHRISADGRRLLVQVDALGEGAGRSARYLDVAFDLATGERLPDRSPQWTAALRAAERLYRDKRVRDQADAAEFAAPLRPPASGKTLDWHRYANEAVQRLQGDSRYLAVDATVIGASDDDDPEALAESLRERLAGGGLWQRPLVLAGPSQDGLLRMLERQTAAAAPGKLQGRRVYVVADAAHDAAVAKALQRTGADYVRIDPTVAIAQPPQRLRNYLEARRSQDAAER